MTFALLTDTWQWTQHNPDLDSGPSYLEDSTSSMYLDYKLRIEKAVSKILRSVQDIKNVSKNYKT